MESYDRNANFGKTPQVLEPEWHMEHPDLSTYKDVNKDTKLPNVTPTTVDNYLDGFDTQVQQNARDMYSNKFLRYVRHVGNTDGHFIHACCHSEMRKATSYFIDIKLDEKGIPQECQCDCGAGQGPDAHCKHVQALLLGLSKITSSGEIATEETCTQRLQTFHKAKKMTGSPSKTQDLNLGCNNFDFDPRPAEFIKEKSYPSFVRNLVLNFNNKDPMPIEMTIEPANPHALNVDHQYCKKDLDEQFLSDNNISEITEAEITYIQDHTIDQKKSSLWIKERVKRLTSSNFGRICTATDLTNKDELAKSFTKYTKLKSKPIRHGNLYEGEAIKEFEEKNNVKVQTCGMFVSKDQPYLAATPDGLLGNDDVVEVKCPFTAANKEISKVSVPWLKEDEQGNLGLDRGHIYFYQIQGQLHCTGREKCILIVYTITDMKSFIIKRDGAFIEDMVGKLKQFYDNYFKQAVLRRFLYRDYYSYSFQPSEVY